MAWKLSTFILSILLISSAGNYSEARTGKNNIKKNLIKRFCFNTLKSKINKKEFKSIANFTCECFYQKFSSGSSIRNSKLFCKEKASEVFNL